MLKRNEQMDVIEQVLRLSHFGDSYCQKNVQNWRSTIAFKLIAFSKALPAVLLK